MAVEAAFADVDVAAPSSSGVYGLTDAIVGTFEPIRNVGMISKSDADDDGEARQHRELRRSSTPATRCHVP